MRRAIDGGVRELSQTNEQLFYNDSGIYISQFRFVTHDGQTYPIRSLQRSYVTLWRPCGFFSNLFGAVGALIICFGIIATPFAIFFLVNGLVDPLYDEMVPWSIVSLILSLITIGIGILVYRRASARRQRRWTANFMFAGGGDFASFGSGTISGVGVHTGGATIYGGGISTSSSTTRIPDYRIWSYDEQWAMNLVAAANEAMVASQQT